MGDSINRYTHSNTEREPTKVTVNVFVQVQASLELLQISLSFESKIYLNFRQRKVSIPVCYGDVIVFRQKTGIWFHASTNYISTGEVQKRA